MNLLLIVLTLVVVDLIVTTVTYLKNKWEIEDLLHDINTNKSRIQTLNEELLRFRSKK